MIIETGIPIPPEARGRPASELCKLVRKMNVGDSIKVNDSDFRRKSISFLRKRLNVKLVTKKIDSSAYRIWRVE
jgi:hypothetical protein